jgi:hypothetical protein
MNRKEITAGFVLTFTALLMLSGCLRPLASPTLTSTPTSAPTLSQIAMVDTAVAVVKTATALAPTPAATSTATSMPSQTPSPEPTATPSQAPSPTSTSTPSGWKQIVVPGEFEIWLPEQWEQWEVTEETLQLIIETVKEIYPQLSEVISTTLRQSGGSGGVEVPRFLAIDIESGDTMNIGVETLPVPLSINDLIILLELTYGQLDVQNVSIHSLDLNNMKAAQVQFDLPMDVPGEGTVTFKYVQYVILKGQKMYVMTFTTDRQRIDDILPIFGQIANSFRVISPAGAEVTNVYTRS